MPQNLIKKITHKHSKNVRGNCRMHKLQNVCIEMCLHNVHTNFTLHHPTYIRNKLILSKLKNFRANVEVAAEKKTAEWLQKSFFWQNNCKKNQMHATKVITRLGKLFAVSIIVGYAMMLWWVRPVQSQRNNYIRFDFSEGKTRERIISSLHCRQIAENQCHQQNSFQQNYTMSGKYKNETQKWSNWFINIILLQSFVQWAATVKATNRNQASLQKFRFSLCIWNGFCMQNDDFFVYHYWNEINGHWAGMFWASKCHS